MGKVHRSSSCPPPRHPELDSGSRGPATLITEEDKMDSRSESGMTGNGSRSQAACPSSA